jgi:hypothetical protein
MTDGHLHEKRPRLVIRPLPDFGGQQAVAIGAGLHRDGDDENSGSLERIGWKARGDDDAARADVEGLIGSRRIAGRQATRGT